MKFSTNNGLLLVTFLCLLQIARAGDVLNNDPASRQGPLRNCEVPGLSCYPDPNSEELRTAPDGEVNTVLNGNGSVNTSFVFQACGLGYTTASTPLLQRGPGSPPNGPPQPATINISGIPNCATIVSALLYCDASGNGVAINATVRNPLGAAQTYPMTIIGQHVDKCWGSAGYARVYSYRADVSSIIKGNGAYQLSGFPVLAPGPNDVDGATLIIVYSDPFATYTGTLVIADGAHVATGGGQIGDNMTGFTACAASSTANAFMVIADLQGVGNTAITMNGVGYTQTAAADRWWNFIQVNTSVTAGQNTARFTANSSGDCYNIVVDGLYFRTNCQTCIVPTMTVNMAASPPCVTTSATATPVGGKPPYTYTWSNGMTTQTITGIPPGNYSVTVRDSGACLTAVGNITIPPTLPPVISVNSPAICDGNSTTLTASGASTYTWAPATGLSGTTGTSVTASPTTTTIYTIIGTDANGCKDTITSTVTVNTNPIVDVNSPTICGGNSTSLTATGASTYSWTGGLPAGATVTTPVLTSSTSYIVTGTDANGCTDTALASVNVLPQPNVTVNSPSICTNNSTTLNANGAASYTWTGGLPPNASVTTPVLTSTTSYTVTGTGANGCINTAVATVTVNPLPTVAVNSPVICAGNTASLTASGASTYTWTGGLPNGANVTTPVLNASTSYTVTGTDVNGCVNTATSNVTVNSNPVVNVNSPTICAGNSIGLNATGASTYTWTGGLPNGANVTTPVLNSTTSYLVTGTDGNGCTDTARATVTVLPLPAVTVNSPSICSGFTATLNANGAASYTWTGGLPPNASVTTPVLSSTTSYTVTGTGANGCTNTATSTVTVNPLPPVAVNSPVICAGNTASLSATGASTYTWTGGLPNGANVTTPVLNSTTSYTVTGTDGNGCVKTAVATVTVNPNPVVTVNSPTICSGETATLNAGGASTYTWTGGLPNGPTVTTPVLNASTSYTVTGTDGNGCKNTATSNVTVTPSPVVSVNSSAICIGKSTVLTASGADTYSWSTGATGPSITVSPSSTASYTVTGFLTGCSVSGSATATVTVNPLPVVNVNSPTICAGNTASLNATGASTYTWTGGLPNGANVTTPVLNSTTSYTVTGTDVNGCINTALSRVTVNPLPNVTVTSPVICSGQTANITANGASTYTWTGGLPANASVTTPVLTSTTTYTVTGTDANSCSNTATSTVTVNPLPTVTVNSPAICTGFNTTLTASGASTYTWTGGLPNGATVSTPVLNTTTSYTVTGTDGNSCSNTATATVTVYQQPTVSVNSPTICTGDQATLIANGASTYTWSGGLAAGNSVNTPPLNGNTSYTVIGTDANTCKDTAVAFVTVNPVKTTNLRQTICEGQFATVGSQNFNQSGLYTVALQTSLGCDSTVNLDLTVNPLLLVDVDMTATQNDICDGDAVTFTATPTYGGTSPVYQWYYNGNPVGTNSPTYTNNSLNDGDSVFVQLTSSEMCTRINPAFSEPVVMKVNRMDYTLPTPAYCAGSTLVLDLNIPQPQYVIDWQHSGITQVTSNTDNVVLTDTASGIARFSIRFGSNYQCQVSDSVAYTVHPLPTISTDVDRDLVRYQDTVQLDVQAGGFYQYQWTTIAELNNDTIPDPQAIITAPSWLQVVATDINGCRISDSLFVNMIDECSEDFVFIPSGFSPNDDGVNDCFGIVYTPVMTEFKLVIFDRWGEKLFEASDVNNCWDGRYKGVPALMDSYSYVVGFRCYNGKFIMKKGIVTLVR